jgi:peroxiredoxin
MKLSGIVVVLVLIAAVAQRPGDGTTTAPSNPGTASAPQPLTPSATEPLPSPVGVGDMVPSVSFQPLDGASTTLRAVAAQGPILLLVAPDRQALDALQRERDRLVEFGVVPIAFLNLRAGEVRALRKQLGLTFVTVPDSRRVVAGQLNCVDLERQRVAPSWFVVDRNGRVRGLRRNQMPEGGWRSIAATALGRPSREIAIPATKR